MRANKSGCLDQCEHGPTVVVYPDAVWYGRVTEADIDEIIERHIIGGEPVARLRLPTSASTAATLSLTSRDRCRPPWHCLGTVGTLGTQAPYV